MAFQKERRELQANLVVPFVFEIDLEATISWTFLNYIE